MKYIWRPRCNYLKKIEDFNLTKGKKLDYKNKKNYTDIFRKVNSENKENSMERL